MAQTSPQIRLETVELPHLSLSLGDPVQFQAARSSYIHPGKFARGMVVNFDAPRTASLALQALHE
jgi:hypothetical protein